MIFSSEIGSDSGESSSDEEAQSTDEGSAENGNGKENKSSSQYLQQLNESIKKEDEDSAYQSSEVDIDQSSEEDFEALDSETRETIIKYYNNPENAELNRIDRKIVKGASGPKIEAFNLDEEEEEGSFEEFNSNLDSQNNMKRRRDQENDDTDEDSWVLHAKKDEITKAREAERKAKLRLAEQERERKNKAIKTTNWQLIGQLLEFLEPVQTVSELLQNLHQKSLEIDKKLKKKQKLINSKEGSCQESNMELRNEKKMLRARISRLTDSAYQLSQRGFKNAFEQPRELLLREYRKDCGEEYKQRDREKRRNTQKEESITISQDDQSDFTDTTNNNAYWEFKWSLGDDKIYGPYDSKTMEAWKSTYFAETPAFARKISTKNRRKFKNALDIDFSK
ncbi:DEBR0S3_09230g1_1 [Brettanomyces bruxellensis]|uniref:DEBR0S3_09230g1_1 n=1 Tax=Dekkera bruxellensis TaxID=5007 RepID=A0A7D9GZW4_DEKBR|nr:DEBR0S3_09230g1_1 [Brettanomyces bruxellensis]